MTQQVWMIYPTGRSSEDFTNKNLAYRRCRTLNGTKSGGKRPYYVQRKYVEVPEWVTPRERRSIKR